MVSGFQVIKPQLVCIEFNFVNLLCMCNQYHIVCVLLECFVAFSVFVKSAVHASAHLVS